jgi:hypothetical protein
MYNYLFYIYAIYKIHNYIDVIDKIVYTSKGVYYIYSYFSNKKEKYNEIYEDLDWVLVSEDKNSYLKNSCIYNK